MNRRIRLPLPIPLKADGLYEDQAFPGLGGRPGFLAIDAHSREEVDWIQRLWRSWTPKLKEAAARHPDTLANWFHEKYLFWCLLQQTTQDETA